MVYHVKTTSINYSITEEDVASQLDNTDDEELIQKEIKRIREGLPQKLEFEIDTTNVKDLDFLVPECISEETGWLVEECTYVYIEE